MFSASSPPDWRLGDVNKNEWIFLLSSFRSQGRCGVSKKQNPKNHWTLLYPAIEGFDSVLRRVPGSPNHQFWDPMILRERWKMWSVFVLWFEHIGISLGFLLTLWGGIWTPNTYPKFKRPSQQVFGRLGFVGVCNIRCVLIQRCRIFNEYQFLGIYCREKDTWAVKNNFWLVSLISGLCIERTL